MNKKYNKELLVGKFLSLMESTGVASNKCSLKVHTDNIYKQNSDKFQNKDLRIYVVERQDKLPKNFRDNLQRLVIRDGQTRIKQWTKIGQLMHCYDYIWAFLLDAEFIKMKAKKAGNDNNNIAVMKIKVYLTEKSLKDESKDKFVGYSLRIMFDLVCVDKSLHSPIRQNDALNQLQKLMEQKSFYPSQYMESINDQKGRDSLKIIMDQNSKQKYFSNFKNNLYTKEFAEQIIFTKSNKQLKFRSNKEPIRLLEYKTQDNLHFIKDHIRLLDNYHYLIQRLKHKIPKQDQEHFVQYFNSYQFFQNSNQRDFLEYLDNKKLEKIKSDLARLRRFKNYSYLAFHIQDYRIQFQIPERIKQYYNMFILENNQQQNIQEYVLEKYEDQDVIEIEKQLIETETPDSMQSVLKDYQKQALTWMLYREQEIKYPYVQKEKQHGERQLSVLWEQITLPKGIKIYQNCLTGRISADFQKKRPTQGGIISDEMGLGKTIMALSLIHKTKKGPNLIVVPKSVLQQWQSEIEKHSHQSTLTYFVFYDKKSKKNCNNLSNYDIILTTFQVVGIEYKKWMKQNGIKIEDEVEEGQAKVKSGKPNKKTVIKNNQNQAKKQKQKKLVQDPIDEFIVDDSDLSLESDDSQSSEEFLMEQIKTPSKKSKQSDSKFVITKQSKNNNTQKKEIKARSNIFEQMFYRVILDEAHNIKNRQSNLCRGACLLNAEYRWCLTGTPLQNKLDDLFSLVQFLRLETLGEYSWWNQNMNKNDNDLEQEFLLDSIVQPIILRRLKCDVQKEETTPLHTDIIWVQQNEFERKIYHRLFNGTKELYYKLKDQTDNPSVHIFQILVKIRQSCDHPQLAIEEMNFKDTNDQIIQKIDSFLKFHQAKANQQLSQVFKEGILDKITTKEEQKCGICYEENQVEFSISKCGHIFCIQCFQNEVKLRGKCPQCRCLLQYNDIIDIVLESEQVKKSLQDCIKTTQSSKLIAVIEEMVRIHNLGEKCIVFTQWNLIIDFLGYLLREKNIKFLSIDGSMTIQQRQKNVTLFSDEVDMSVLILSIRSSSTGLNLQMANHVLIVDPWWNPALEDQAIGRSHRIGQTKPVYVKRFLCKDTIEEKINHLHHKKRQLINNVLKKGKSQYQEDIEYLFQ
ncbi:hypothetical protein pb186bvf_002917 [Paramecium bursaria]